MNIAAVIRFKLQNPDNTYQLTDNSTQILNNR